MNFFQIYFRLYDAVIVRKGEAYVDIYYEKCDLDLQNFLRMVNRDLSEWECRNYAKQVISLSFKLIFSRFLWV